LSLVIQATFANEHGPIAWRVWHRGEFIEQEFASKERAEIHLDLLERQVLIPVYREGKGPAVVDK
jgi:hypothetical protein